MLKVSLSLFFLLLVALGFTEAAEVGHEYCPKGKVFDAATQTCKCPYYEECNYPQIFDEDTCQCRCEYETCPSPQVLDQIACQCKCPYFPKGYTPPCPYKQVFDPYTCTCQCPELLEGSGNAIEEYCPPYQYYDSERCECVCLYTKTCYENQFFDKSTCECQCKWIEECPPYKVFNYDTCQCECQKYPHYNYCPGEQVFDEDTCKCRCPNEDDAYCPENHVFDTYSCKCQCNLYCDFPLELDYDKCQCVCNKQCPYGYVLTGDCECVRLTCDIASSESACQVATCRDNPSQSCYYIHQTKSCVCPCCRPKYAYSHYHNIKNFCLDFSRPHLGKDKCTHGSNSDFCDWFCPYY